MVHLSSHRELKTLNVAVANEKHARSKTAKYLEKVVYNDKVNKRL